MRHTALVMAGLAALALTAAPASAQTRVVAKKPTVAPIQTTLGGKPTGLAGKAAPTTGNQIKIAPGANGAGLVAAGGGNIKGNGLVAAGGGNIKPR